MSEFAEENVRICLLGQNLVLSLRIMAYALNNEMRTNVYARKNMWNSIP